MPSVVDWSKLGGRAAKNEARRNGDSSNDGTRPEWLRISSEVKVRPIGQACEICKFFVQTPKGNRSVVVNPDDRDKVAAILQAETGKEVRPNTRFAMKVIDRSDGRIKIMEGGMQIFGFFGKWHNNMGIHPGSAQGYDWMITVEGEGLNKKYTPIPLGQTNLTEDELALAEKNKEQYTLTSVYEATPADQVVDRLFGEKGPSSEPQPGSQPQSSVQTSASRDPAKW